MCNADKISVCIPTFNGDKYIKQQIDSILTQLKPDDEIIISDDSSTDNTLNILNAYSDKRIKIFDKNIFYSPIFNLENALKHAKGDYIFIADQDDIWFPEKVEVMLSYLLKYDIVVSDCVVVGKNSEILFESFFQHRKSGPGFIKNLLYNSYLGCCTAFRRKMLKFILPFPAKIPMHDIWIGLVCEVFGKSVFIDDKLIKYRRHGDNVSSASEKSKNSLIKKLYYRYILILLILARLFRTFLRGTKLRK